MAPSFNPGPASSVPDAPPTPAQPDIWTPAERPSDTMTDASATPVEAHALFLPAPKSWDMPAMEAQAQASHLNLSQHIHENLAAVPEEEPCGAAKAYKQVMEHGKAAGGSHGAAAKQFEKEFKKHLKLNEAMKNEYEDAGSSYDKQREIKMKFAGIRFRNVMNEKSKTERLVDIATVDAEYCTFPRAWDREGRDAVGYKNTQEYFASAVQKWTSGETFLGHPYCKWDPDRKTGMVLHKREKVKPCRDLNRIDSY